MGPQPAVPARSMANARIEFVRPDCRLEPPFPSVAAVAPGEGFDQHSSSQIYTQFITNLKKNLAFENEIFAFILGDSPQTVGKRISGGGVEPG